MKQKQKKLNIMSIIVFLVLALMCVSNVTYSYFTATAKSEGDFSFQKIETYFSYNTSGYVNTRIDGTLSVVPLEGTIDREVPFTFAIEQTNAGQTTYTQISKLYIENNGCNVFVRFWVDAYLSSGTAQTGDNYGRFFFFTAGSTSYYTNQGGNNSSGLVSGTYYVTQPLGDDEDWYKSINIGNQLMLSDIYDASGNVEEAVPLDIFGGELDIYISFEAVQVANEAYKFVFDDDRGYYNGWNNFFK